MKMHAHYSIYFILLLGIAACDKPSTVTGTGLELLSVQVTSSEQIDFSTFNEALAVAGSKGEQWAKDPVAIVRRFVHWGRGQEAVLLFKGVGEIPNRYEFVAISNGFQDDSVRGERFDITLEADSRQIWRVTSATTSWRCWPGRGHESYGAKPCS